MGDTCPVPHCALHPLHADFHYDAHGNYVSARAPWCFHETAIECTGCGWVGCNDCAARHECPFVGERIPRAA